MRYDFTKMNGLGNDFVILDGRQKRLAFSSAQIQRLADRRRGIGCDQLIVLDAPRSREVSTVMRIFNADGSEVEACGNATRCVGHLLNLETNQENHTLQTVAGLLTTKTHDGLTTVDMGGPALTSSTIPLADEVDTLYLPIDVQGMEAPVAVGVGNPHMVFFVSDVNEIHLERLGQEMTKHPLYPKGTNVEINQVLSRQHLRMRVWERGTGITLACATGACASVVAGVRRGLLDQGVPITVSLDGGDLMITYDGERLQMAGPTSYAYQGHFGEEIFA